MKHLNKGNSEKTKNFMKDAMAVSAMSSAYVAVLLGGNTFKIQKIDRDEDMIRHIIQMEEHLRHREMPLNIL